MARKIEDAPVKATLDGTEQLAIAGTQHVTMNGIAARIAAAGSAATLTTPRTIFGQNFDGSAPVSNNVVFGTQTNKATLTYATDQARTLAVPELGGDRTLSFINQAETIPAVKTFSANPVLSANSAILDFSSETGVKKVTTGGTTNLNLDPGGNVGIAKDTPTAGFKLDVNGKAMVAQTGNDAQLRNVQVVTEMPGSPVADQIYIVIPA